MSGAGRPCEVIMPHYLIQRMIDNNTWTTLTNIEKEFGLHVTSRDHGGSNLYTIRGPNIDILQLALDTLERRLSTTDDKSSVVSGEIENRQAVWTFQGEYASKAAHLFKDELDQMRKIPSVHMNAKPFKLEICCGYERLEEVKALVDEMERQIEGLYEGDIELHGSHSEMVRLRQFINRKNKYDFTVVCMLREQSRKVTVYGRTEVAVQRVKDEWAMCSRGQIKAPSPTLSLTSFTQDPRYRSEIRVPPSVLTKLEKLRCGMDCIILSLEREFGLKVIYTRRKSMSIFGPQLPVLELAMKTIIQRFVQTSLPENGVVNLLRGRNVLWRFTGTYAKKVVHLFPKELDHVRKLKTVTVQIHPSKVCPTSVEVLCGVRQFEIVKREVEKLVGLVHTLFVRELSMPQNVDEVTRVKELMQDHNAIGDVLCLFESDQQPSNATQRNNLSQRATCNGGVYGSQSSLGSQRIKENTEIKVYGRNELVVSQVLANLKEGRRRAVKDVDTPLDCWNMFRQLYQARVPDHIVKRLQETPAGVVLLVRKIESDYGVRTIFNKNKHMILVSPSVEMLELVLDTLEERYNDNVDTNGEANGERRPNGGAAGGENRFIEESAVVQNLTEHNDVNEQSVKKLNDKETVGENDDLSELVDLPNTDDTDDDNNDAIDVNKLMSRGIPTGQSDTNEFNDSDLGTNTVTEIPNKHSLTLKRHSNNAISRLPDKFNPRARNQHWTRGGDSPWKLRKETIHMRSSLKGSRGKSKDGPGVQKTVTFETL